MIDAVVFDAFGTLVRISQHTNPYRELMREGRRQGVVLTSESAHIAMTASLSLADMAAHLGIALTASKRVELAQALEMELSSVLPYPDAVEAVLRLRDAGLKLGVCSNLAAPYGPVVRNPFLNMDGYALSYELGVMKPDPVIYQSVCQQMGVTPGNYFNGEAGRVLMIGDSQRCDQDGPRSVGIMGHKLDRSGRGHITNLKQFAELVIAHNRVEGAALMNS